MRNNNTFGTKNPTGSIGRYGTKDDVPAMEGKEKKKENHNDRKS